MYFGFIQFFNMEKLSTSSQQSHTNQSQEFSRNSLTFYPSPSTLISGPPVQMKSNNYSQFSQDPPNSPHSFKSPYDIEENQFNCLFDNNEDNIKDNNIRNDCHKKKIMESDSLIKQKYVTFILDNDNKSTHSFENPNGNKYNVKSSNLSRTQCHENHEESKNRLNQSENKNANYIQSRYLKTSNIDQRSARKSFIHPSATSNVILNRKLSTAKTSQRKKDNFIGNSMHPYTPNLQSESNPSNERITKKSPVVSIIMEN